MIQHIITEPIDVHLIDIMPKILAQINNAEAPKIISFPYHDKPGVSAPLISIGPSGLGGYCQREICK